MGVGGKVWHAQVSRHIVLKQEICVLYLHQWMIATNKCIACGVMIQHHVLEDPFFVHLLIIEILVRLAMFVNGLDNE